MKKHGKSNTITPPPSTPTCPPLSPLQYRQRCAGIPPALLLYVLCSPFGGRQRFAGRVIRSCSAPCDRGAGFWGWFCALCRATMRRMGRRAKKEWRQDGGRPCKTRVPFFFILLKRKLFFHPPPPPTPGGGGGGGGGGLVTAVAATPPLLDTTQPTRAHRHIALEPGGGGGNEGKQLAEKRGVEKKKVRKRLCPGYIRGVGLCRQKKPGGVGRGVR